MLSLGVVFCGLYLSHARLTGADEVPGAEDMVESIRHSSELRGGGGRAEAYMKTTARVRFVKRLGRDGWKLDGMMDAEPDSQMLVALARALRHCLLHLDSWYACLKRAGWLATSVAKSWRVEGAHVGD